jgi:hypothetical protein
MDLVEILTYKTVLSTKDCLKGATVISIMAYVCPMKAYEKKEEWK